jgi:hypothetical protein
MLRGVDLLNSVPIFVVAETSDSAIAKVLKNWEWFGEDREMFFSLTVEWSKWSQGLLAQGHWY